MITIILIHTYIFNNILSKGVYKVLLQFNLIEYILTNAQCRYTKIILKKNKNKSIRMKIFL